MLERVKVTHVIGALVAGGAERFVVDLCIAQQVQGMGVELVCLLPKRDPVGDRWAAMLERAGVSIYAGMGQKLGPRTVLWLAKFLKRDNVDIVHIHLSYTEAAYYLSRFLHKRKYRVLRTIHNTSTPGGGIWTWAFNHSDIRTSISCGKAAHAAYSDRVRGSLTCIPYGLNFDWPRHDPAHREERLGALGLDSEKTHFIAAGSMSAESVEKAQKAQNDLIHAWKAGGLGGKGGVLHILGDGTLRPKLEELASGDESIIFHGVVPNMSDWMGAADVYAMPSRWEGLPLAGIEATATGIPCVFSDIPPLRELENTVAGFFPVGDTNVLSERLLERIGTRETASQEAVDDARARFGIERTASEYHKVYDSLD